MRKFQTLNKVIPYFLRPQRLNKSIPASITSNTTYQPTFFLNHHLLQSIYQVISPTKQIPYQRQKIYFEDGGHISLDWVHIKTNKSKQNIPVLLIMHGMTGGSEENYIKQLVQKGVQNGYNCVCINSRGINTSMTSPIPFVGLQFTQLQASLQRIQAHYPNSDIYMIGTSFGGNYLARYLLKYTKNNVKAFAGISLPFNVRHVINNMNIIYQRFFVKSYIKKVVFNHPIMKYWQKIGLVDMKLVLKSKTLKQFHQRITTKIMGYDDVDAMFDEYKITNEQIKNLKYPTIILTSKDDPIVPFQTFPISVIKQNNNIKLIITQKGGHCCWFSGIKPKRWYPQPIFQFFRDIQDKNS